MKSKYFIWIYSFIYSSFLYFFVIGKLQGQASVDTRLVLLTSPIFIGLRYLEVRLNKNDNNKKNW